MSAQVTDQLRAAMRSGEGNLLAAGAAPQSAQFNLSYARVASPVAGRVSRTALTAGNLLAAGDPVLAAVVADERVHACFNLREEQLPQFRAASG